MTRVIRSFRTSDESFAGEYILADIPHSKLQFIFLVPVDDPMFDSYPIYLEQSEQLTSYCDVKFDFSQFDYFLECEE